MALVNIVYHPKGIETVKRLKTIGEQRLGLTINLVNGEREENPIYSMGQKMFLINYGSRDGFDLNKKETLLLLENVIPNTLLSAEDLAEIKAVNPTLPLIVKNPTRLMIARDVPIGTTAYLYVENKSEWRVNYSFGKVNNIFNKNITPTTIFGKADSTTWTVEEDKKIRGTLIRFTKAIAEIITRDYPSVTHFGLDIIMDNSNGEFYLLELNRAHSLNDESCYLFLKGYVEQYIPELLVKEQQTNNNSSKSKDSLINEIIGKYHRKISSLKEEDLEYLNDDLDDDW